MQQRKGPKKLQLKIETLKQVSSGIIGKGETYSCPGCTVLTTCTPGGCDNTAARK
jgi:hypothetical protein